MHATECAIFDVRIRICDLCMKSAFKGPGDHALSLRRHPENNVLEGKRLALLRVPKRKQLDETFRESACDCGHGFNVTRLRSYESSGGLVTD